MITNIIDFHTHILPGIDDGSRDEKESFEMLKYLHSQGIKKVCFTPHFYRPEETIEEFSKRREEAFGKIKKIVEEFEMDVYLGSEVYFDDSLLSTQNVNQLCINGKNYLLLEFSPYNEFSERFINKLIKFKTNLRVKLIFAHIDRYVNLFKDEQLINEFIDMGFLMQLNLNSLESGFFTRKRIFNYIETGKIHLFGTDCHNMTSRMPEYKKYIDIICKKVGEEPVQKIFDNIKSIIN